MKKINYTTKAIIFLAVLLITCWSCNTDDDNDIVGSWNLKKIDSTCMEEQEDQEVELINEYCLKVTTVESSDTIVLTTTQESCMRLLLENSGTGSLISGNNEEMKTVNINYTVTNNMLDICDSDNNCLMFDITDDALLLSLEMTAISGTQCIRTFTLRK